MKSKSSTGSVKLEVFEPTGAAEIMELHAPRLDTLAGKTICEVSQESDGQSWEARRTFPYIRELLKKRYPDIKIIPHTEFPSSPGSADIDGGIGKVGKAKGCQAFIVGNAA
jgi:hypothetical protein